MPILSTAKFIDTVVPSGNRYLGFTNGRTNDSGRQIINCTAFGPGSECVRKSILKTGVDLYFALASFKVSRIKNEEKGWMQSFRHQDNVDKLKSLWLDVDFKSYPSPEECIKDIGRFLEDIPHPTFIVNSGGGLHLYWVFEDELSVSRWSPMARGLAGLARHRELKADFGVTTDSARVLRLPGSQNQKYDEKPLCEIKSMGNYVHVERMEKLLLPYAATISPQQQMGVPPFDIPDETKNLFHPAMNSDLSDGYDGSVASSFAQIAKECMAVQHTLATGGADDGYARWKNMLHLAAFTEDGEDFIHDLSKGYAGYDPDEVSMRFAESQRVRDEERRGPTACKTFSSGSSKCDTCPHLNNIKSPWVLGITKKTTETPPSYVSRGGTYRLVMEENEDGESESTAQFVCGAALTDWKLVPSIINDEDNDGLHLCVNYDGGGKHKGRLRFSSGDLDDVRTTRVKLSGQSLMWNEGAIKKFREVAMAWITQLRKNHTHKRIDSLGWTADGKSFVIGNAELVPGGERDVQMDDALAEEYTPMGDPGHWDELVEILINDTNDQFPFMLAAGFASPLMSMGSPLSLALSAYSRDSGTGKSTLLKAIYGAFCHPRTMMALDDTPNYITARIGMTQGLPVAWDEIRGARVASSMTSVIFRVTQGKSKGRLDRSASMQSTSSLDAMVLCATNTPLMDYVNDQVQQTDAGALRFMEFNMDVQHTDNPKVRVLIGKLERNYGHAGRRYLRFLVDNRDAVENLLLGVREALEKDAKFRPEERFWADGLTKIVTAAILMKQSGVAGIDVTRVRAYALEVLRQQRLATGAIREVRGELLPTILTSIADDTVVTDYFLEDSPGQSILVHRPPRGNKVQAHVSVDAKNIRVSNAALVNFAKDKHLSITNMRAELRAEHGGTASRFTLGAGTTVGLPQCRGMEFDLGDDSIAAWRSSLQDSGTP